MKKIVINHSLIVLLLALFILTFSISGKAKPAGSVAINSTNFPDAAFRNYVSDNFDTNGNGSLSQTEIDAATYIYVVGQEISSLKGVEYFTSLRELYCGQNELTSLNVTKCTALTTLYCNNNQLSSLNVASCPDLINLSCGTNRLTSLNVTANPKLALLTCDENELTSLNVTANPALSFLNCNFNSLTSLNLTGNTKLDSLNCGHNDLTALNLSKCTRLTNLICNGNSLSTLNISGCTALQVIQCNDNELTSLSVSHCPNLTSLYCYSNCLSSLNVSGCIKLDAVNCGNNQIPSLDVSGLAALMSLNCNNNSLTTLNISGCSALKYFYGGTNQLTSLNFSGFPVLEYIDCSNNPLTSLNVAICPELYRLNCEDSGLPTLNLYGCPKLLLAYWEGDEYATGSYRYWIYNVPEENLQYALHVDDTTGIIVDSVKPIIRTQPTRQIVKAGATAKFTVSAMGDGLTYQWQWRTSPSGTWKNSTSATTGYNKATLKVSATTARDGYQYRCKVKNSAGQTTYSGYATLYVLGIRTQPSSVTTTAGKTAAFQVEATGKSLTYRWQWRTSSSGTWKNSSSATTGYNTATLKVSATTARHGYQYRCRVKDLAGNTVYTQAVTLNVLGIKTQPSSASVTAGNTATFKVAATGTGKTYQWQWRTSSTGEWKNCTSSTQGYNTATLKVAGESRRNGYQYRCRVKDSAGNTVYSKAATLTVE